MAAEPADIVSRLVGPAGPGDILLLHDGLEPHARRPDARATAAAVRPLVAGLRGKGLEPERLDRLLGVRPYRETGQGTGGEDAAPRPAIHAATPAGR